MIKAPTLRRTIDDLGKGILTVVVAPDGLEVEVRDVEIHDRLDGRPIVTGDLVLAVSLDESEVKPVLAAAGAAGAAAVAIKPSDEEGDRLAEIATEARTALLAVPREMAWGQLHSLLRTALAAAGRDGDSDLGRIPMGDLFALANAVATTVGGPVTIEDTRSVVLAYSSQSELVDLPRRQTILMRRVPDRWVERLDAAGVFRQLWSGDEVVRYRDPDQSELRDRLAIAVRAGGEILGSIWVAEGDQPFGATAEGALKEAAAIAALHLLRHRMAADLERRLRSDTLRSVLEGQAAAETLTSSLGIDPRAHLTVMALELQDGDGPTLALLADRAVDVVALYCEAFRRQAACMATGRTVYAVLPDTDGMARDRLLEFARDLAGRASEALRADLCVGIGSTVSRVSEVPRSRREADQVLRALRRRGQGPTVANIDDVRSQAILEELKAVAEAQPHLHLGKVAALAEHDGRRKTSYVATLKAYLDHFGDVPAAAAAVHVHPNTFRYRIRRLEELSGLDLADPDERLVTHLQLRLSEP